MKSEIKFVRFEEGSKPVKVMFHRNGNAIFDVKRGKVSVTGSLMTQPYFGELFVVSFTVPLSEFGYSFDLRDNEDFENIYYHAAHAVGKKGYDVYQMNRPITEGIFTEWYRTH